MCFIQFNFFKYYLALQICFNKKYNIIIFLKQTFLKMLETKYKQFIL